MKVLIVYYSLTGTTRKLAERMAGKLKCDIERLPILGSGKRIEKNDYDLVIVGTPIWLYAPAFPASGFLSRNKNKLPDVAFFCTYQTSIGASFAKMERKCGKKPLGLLQLKAEEIDTADGDRQIGQFLDEAINKKSA